MTTYYAIPCPDRLRLNFDKLIHALDHRLSEPLSPLLIDVANDYTDVIVEEPPLPPPPQAVKVAHATTLTRAGGGVSRWSTFRLSKDLGGLATGLIGKVAVVGWGFCRTAA